MEQDIIGTIGANSINPFVIGEELKKNADKEPEVKDESKKENVSGENQPEETSDTIEGSSKGEKTQETKSDSKNIEEDYSSYSNAATLALSLKEDGVLPEDYEIKSDLSGKELKSVIEDIAAQREQEKEEALRNQLQSEYSQKGYDEALAREVLFYRNGGNPQMITKRAQYNNLLNYQAKDEEEKEKIIRFMFQEQGIDQKAADLAVKGLTTEEELEEYYQKTKYFFKQRIDQIEQEEEEYNENIIRQAKEQEEKTIQQIKDIANRKKVGVFDLDDKESKDLVKYMTEPSETIDLPDSPPIKVTPFKKAVLDLENSPEKLAELAVFLMKGSKFFDQKATDKAHQDLLSKLDAIPSERVSGKSEDGRTVNIEKNISEIIGQQGDDVLFTL